MSDMLPPLTLAQLALCLLPVVIVIGILWRWSLRAGEATYGVLRMIFQLLLVGYVLSWLFAAESGGLTIAALLAMMLIAAWIALRPLGSRHAAVYGAVLAGLAAGSVTTLAFTLAIVLSGNPLHVPQMLIPLAGMTLSNAMNTSSLALERYQGEIAGGAEPAAARSTAFRAALIPVINTMFATGLVSFPGTMTGQIISGVSPLVAARYQILVMSMLFAASGISAACCLLWAGPRLAMPARA